MKAESLAEAEAARQTRREAGALIICLLLDRNQHCFFVDLDAPFVPKQSSQTQEGSLAHVLAITKCIDARLQE
jgi:hypothetical protein